MTPNNADDGGTQSGRKADDAKVFKLDPLLMITNRADHDTR
jgi:hypothetical protein